MLRNLRKSGEEVAAYIHTIQSLATEIDRTEQIQELMGLEGSCRKVYYEALGILIKNGMKLDSRTKQPPKDPVNAMISFGNSLMYTAIISEIYKTVLDPTISFLHEPSTKRFSLSLDLAEIFKPFVVDPLIISLLNNRRIQEKHFEENGDAVYLSEEGRKKFIEAFDEKMQTTIKHRKLNRNVSYRYLIRLEAYKLIKHFIGDEEYKPFKAWW
jgi:CRISPR-associated protein Cas1